MSETSSAVARCVRVMVGATTCALTIAAGCGGGGATPSELLQNAAVVAALQDLAARADPSPTVGSSGCQAVATTFLKQGVGAAFDAAARGESSNQASDITGTWTWSDCASSDSDSFPALSACSGSITWSNEANGRISQENVGGVTAGSGTDGFITRADPDGALIIQENKAAGAGCQQDVVNLLIKDVRNGVPEIRGVDAVLSSTCPAPKWKCFATEVTR